MKKTIIAIIAAAVIILILGFYNEPEFDAPVSYERHVAECTGSTMYDEVADDGIIEVTML